MKTSRVDGVKGRRGRAWYLFLLLNGMSKTLPKSRRISSTSLFPKQAWIGPPWANLIMAPSLALPRVFQRISVIVEPSPWTRTLEKGNRTLFPVTSSSKYLSKLHVLQSVLHLTRALKPALSVSKVEMPFVKLLPASWILGVPFVSYTTCATVMMFCVSVPVLSEQMQDVEPSVSTPALIDHEDAIDATASSLPRRDGPDAFQRLKFGPETTHVIVRRDAAACLPGS